MACKINVKRVSPFGGLLRCCAKGPKGRPTRRMKFAWAHAYHCDVMSPTASRRAASKAAVTHVTIGRAEHGRSSADQHSSGAASGFAVRDATSCKGQDCWAELFCNPRAVRERWLATCDAGLCRYVIQKTEGCPKPWWHVRDASPMMSIAEHNRERVEFRIGRAGRHTVHRFGGVGCIRRE